ncbi:GNAT family N-acetyltransferase [Enterococcus gallinarum]|uniref:GNAT family N-acetyltransferase n=1 Tax=Enterococcus gallinarum TaxID=1353 RepID=UPI0029542769|nr:GNAT family N-acetyltransferase [Enterococcus gallinarum]MDV7873543.1 GNAT family N-acetyltransferase [Enterococcus gallinarum]
MIRALSPKESLPWPLLLDADPEKEAVDRYIQASEILVFENEQQIVGVIVYQLQTAGWEIMNVAVAPEAQNQGIGGRLLTAALTLYKKMGFVRHSCYSESNHLERVIVLFNEINRNRFLN